VEIKCQLDAREVFIADLIACSTCFGHHYTHHQELKSIIQWLLPVVFGAVVFQLLVWCGAEGYVSGLQGAENSLSQLAQAIFEPNFFPYKYPNVSQTYSFFTPTCLWRWNRQNVPKRWHIKFRRRGITHKKAYSIQNTAKVWNQECIIFAKIEVDVTFDTKND